MKKCLQFTFLLTFICGSVRLSAQDREGVNSITPRADGSVLLENFEKYNIGTIPSDWYNQKGEQRPFKYSKENKAPYEYAVQQENGNKFLRYDGSDAKHLNFPLVNKDVNIHHTPILSWKWRVIDIPTDADDEDNDAAASIYVAFDMGRVLFKKVPKSIRYTWSSNLAKGTELSKFFGNQKVIVMGCGSGSGQWQTFNRNIMEDYKRMFGENPPETPLAILILSDGDDTGQMVKADYDDIMLKPAINN
jgi:hypothetical protein